MQVASSRPVAWLLLAALAACGHATADGGWRDDPGAPPDRPESEQAHSLGVGMWGDDDGWSIIDGVRVGSSAHAGPKQGDHAIERVCEPRPGARVTAGLAGGSGIG